MPQNFFNGLCRIAALHNESVLDVTNRAVNEFLDYEEGITPEQLAQRLAEIEAEQGRRVMALQIVTENRSHPPGNPSALMSNWLPLSTGTRNRRNGRLVVARTDNIRDLYVPQNQKRHAERRVFKEIGLNSVAHRVLEAVCDGLERAADIDQRIGGSNPAGIYASWRAWVISSDIS